MFDPRQMQNLEALLDTLVPPDDYPGAWAAGVGDYLLRQLQGDLSDLLPQYRLWLEALEAEARQTQGRPFAALALVERTALLEKIEAGAVLTEWKIPPAPFFAKIVEHCGEGYYSDPGNGGNRDGIAWQMVGFEVRG